MIFEVRINSEELVLMGDRKGRPYNGIFSRFKMIMSKP